MPGRARPVALAGRGIAGVAARAISVRVGDMSNIAAAGSDLVLGKKVRHVGHRRCRHSHEAAQCGNDTDRESFHETGRVSSVVHDSFSSAGPEPIRLSVVEWDVTLQSPAQKIEIFTAASYL
jgi:hypothetical protein